MIRRKLFAYTAMFTAGISAGFFITEKARIISGAAFMITIAVSVMVLTVFTDEKNTGRTDGSSASEYRISRKKGERTASFRLIAFLAAGFILFTCRYITYGTSIAQPADEIRSIEGFAVSASVKDGKLSVMLSDTDAVRHGIRVMLNMYEAENCDPAAIIGRRITAYGTLREPQSADNPGCFDYRLYLRSRGAGWLFTANEIETSEEMSLYGRYRSRLYTAREEFLDAIGDEEDRAFIKGTVFGDKSDISEEILDDFSYNGTGHILAVSGLHVGFLYSLILLITGKRKSAAAAVFTLVVLVMYGDMTMWSPSTARAVTVITVSMMSLYARRPFDLLTTVSAAAMILLIREPYQLFSAGFQMTFLALLGIAFLSGPLTHFMGEPLAVMISVQAGIVPVTAYIFHRINPVSILINIPVIFLASLLVPLAMTALMISICAGTVPVILTTAAGAMTDLLIRFNSAVSADGFFSGRFARAGPGAVILVYLIMFAASSEWCRIRLIRREYRIMVITLICIAAVSLCAGAASYNMFSDDEIVFVSVGQGDCTHIRAEGRNILIDGGGDTERDIAEDVLIPYLLSNGAERAEFALVTHLHTDHALGIFQLADEFPVGAVGIPADYRASLEHSLSHPDTEEDNDSVLLTDMIPDNTVYVEQGSRIQIADDVYIEPVWPVSNEKGDISIDDPNENNMVYIISYRGIRTMVTGDLLEEDEIRMVDHYRGTDMLDCDILKVAHHGSKSSSSEVFLDAVSPDIAVIQVGRNNLYGHPHQQTIDRLEARGIQIYRTDINGAAGIDIRKNRIITDTVR